MLVLRPQREVFKYKGYSVFIKSDSQVEDMKKFDEVASELEKILNKMTWDN